MIRGIMNNRTGRKLLIYNSRTNAIITYKPQAQAPESVFVTDSRITIKGATSR